MYLKAPLVDFVNKKSQIPNILRVYRPLKVMTNDNWNFVSLGYRNRQPIQHNTHCSKAHCQDRLFHFPCPFQTEETEKTEKTNTG